MRSSSPSADAPPPAGALAACSAPHSSGSAAEASIHASTTEASGDGLGPLCDDVRRRFWAEPPNEAGRPIATASSISQGCRRERASAQRS